MKTKIQTVIIAALIALTSLAHAQEQAGANCGTLQNPAPCTQTSNYLPQPASQPPVAAPAFTPAPIAPIPPASTPSPYTQPAYCAECMTQPVAK